MDVWKKASLYKRLNDFIYTAREDIEKGYEKIKELKKLPGDRNRAGIPLIMAQCLNFERNIFLAECLLTILGEIESQTKGGD